MSQHDNHWWDDVDFVPQQVQMLERGDTGDEVKRLQQLLKEAGYAITVDGDYGPATVRVIKAFQKDHELVIDGRVGPKTLWRIEQHPKDPKVLSQADLEDAAVMLDVSVASIMAVNSVESRGSGFFDNDKPAILYERHIMRRRLGEHGIDPTPYLTKYPNLVSRNTGGYLGGVAEHQRLDQACTIHETSALESASWGLFQIMGFHWKHLGYPSVQTYVGEMQRGERQQLHAFVRFIRADPVLHEALKVRDWTTFARRYNGPAYKKNFYDTKMAAAFQEFSTPSFV